MRIKDARKSFPFYISKHHVENGCPADKNRCTVADAVAAQFQKNGKDVLAVQIGPKRAVVCLAGGLFIRHSIPFILEKAIDHFDKTGDWNLPDGIYKLGPLQKSLTRRYVKARSIERRKQGDPNMDKNPPMFKTHIEKSRSKSIRVRRYSAAVHASAI